MFPLLGDGLPESQRGGRDPSSLFNLSSSPFHVEEAQRWGGGKEAQGWGGEMEAWTESWLARLLLNLAGYATVLLPGYLFILYTRRTGYLERAGRGPCLISNRNGEESSVPLTHLQPMEPGTTALFQGPKQIANICLEMQQFFSQI